MTRHTDLRDTWQQVAEWRGLALAPRRPKLHYKLKQGTKELPVGKRAKAVGQKRSAGPGRPQEQAVRGDGLRFQEIDSEEQEVPKKVHTHPHTSRYTQWLAT